MDEARWAWSKPKVVIQARQCQELVPLLKVKQTDPVLPDTVGSKRSINTQSTEDSSQGRDVTAAIKLAEYDKNFRLFDTAGDGQIDLPELLDALKKIGQPTSAEDAKKMLGSLDNNGDGGIDFPEFVSLMRAIEKQAQGQTNPVDIDEVSALLQDVEPNAGVEKELKTEGDRGLGGSSIVVHPHMNKLNMNMNKSKDAAEEAVESTPTPQKQRGWFSRYFRDMADAQQSEPVDTAMGWWFVYWDKFATFKFFSGWYTDGFRFNAYPLTNAIALLFWLAYDLAFSAFNFKMCPKITKLVELMDAVRPTPRKRLEDDGVERMVKTKEGWRVHQIPCNSTAKGVYEDLRNELNMMLAVVRQIQRWSGIPEAERYAVTDESELIAEHEKLQSKVDFILNNEICNPVAGKKKKGMPELVIGKDWETLGVNYDLRMRLQTVACKCSSAPVIRCGKL